ncbi:hypothetical protein [Mesorhizobium sp. B2-3-15]|uniref:hypothetical protein n=1 Tax=Mesorhizobium sp. B2-3-15 TaxID=2589949 RepID=UPI00112B4B7A|nr:hypothetical protein [Mesorhizobium sp. B2-3-15]TPL75116.1 hypothetical protein FJ954_09170 [Mesorhizobium sp. B2-3-15]
MTPAELLESHAEAGARYQTALAELEAAFINLAAHDRALENQNVPVGPTPVRGFFGHPDSRPWPLRHAEFAATGGLNWQDETRARGNELINSVVAASV